MIKNISLLKTHPCIHKNSILDILLYNSPNFNLLKHLGLAVIFVLHSICSFGQLKEYLIGFYSNENPNTYEKLHQIRDFGFNTVYIYQQGYASVYTNPSTAYLDDALALKLDVILLAGQMLANLNTYDEKICQDVLNYYRNYPAIKGYYIYDEAAVQQFAKINEFATALKSYDPNLLRNALLLGKGTYGYLFGTANTRYATYDEYEDYVQQYIDVTHPNILTFDSYSLWDNNLTYYDNNYFEGLDVIAKKSQYYNIPFVLVTTHYKDEPRGYQDCTYNTEVINIYEFNFLLFSSLVYGGKGISYWHWICDDFFNKIPSDDQSYFNSIYGKLRNRSEILLKLRFRGAYHKTDTSTIISGALDNIPNQSKWSNFYNDYYANEIFRMPTIMRPFDPFYGNTQNLVISFLTDDLGSRYFWIFNKSMTMSTYINMFFKSTFSIIDILENTMLGNISSLSVTLAPGEAKLFKVDNSLQSILTVSGTQSFTSQLGSFWAENIEINGPAIKYQNGAIADYHAEKTIIGAGVQILRGSTVSIKRSIRVYNENLELKHALIGDTITNIQDESIGLIVSPNPSLGLISLTIRKPDDENVNIQIADFSGKSVYKQQTK